MLSPLRKTRLLREYTLHQISVLTGLGASKLSLLERGYLSANDDEKLRLAWALNVSVGEIFPEEVERND